MWTIENADFIKMWMDLQQHLLQPIQQSQNIIKKNATMVFYNEKEQLYLETDASGVGLGASVLHMRDRMWFPRNEAPDRSVLWQIVFASKS